MNNPEENAKNFFKNLSRLAKGDEALILRHGAELPEDFDHTEFLKNISASYKSEIAKLPVDLETEYEELFSDQIEKLNTALAEGDDRRKKYFTMLLRENWKRLGQDQTRYFANKYSEEQADKAMKRWAEDEFREAVSGIIRELAKLKDELGWEEQPSELWPLLYSGLQEQRIGVKEVASSRILDSYYIIEGYKENYTYKAFRKAIERARK